ncbi:MAG TPA: VOC family protein [Mycobacteriales bacterium]|nr:VOC family protein [Mycobacteriales bacterium]
MITAVHTLIYSDDEEATRAFLRDVLGWPHVDAHGGWLIFRSGPSETAVHPTGGGATHHQISPMCDDLEGTVAELTAKGATFGDRHEQPWGKTISMHVPGADNMLLYEPLHPKAYDL